MRTGTKYRDLRFPGEKDFSGCAIVGIMDQTGSTFSGEDIITAISLMRDRSNGLGGGFAAYGIYPDYADQYAFHVMLLQNDARIRLEEFLNTHFNVIASEKVNTRPVKRIKDAPVLWRYFLEVGEHGEAEESDDDYVVRTVMQVNEDLPGVFVSSSGKNMGVFKGVGFPEEIGEFYGLDDYKGYLWTAHGRFPTNTVGWWGGCHPFNLLDWSVVHNGELSSYGINQRYLEMYGYRCTLKTDTEVVAYTMDLLMRRHKLPLEIAAAVIAAPLWDDIDRMPEPEQRTYAALRQTYGSLLLNGPFGFVLANRRQMVGITDRIRLRPLVAATKGPKFFISSEEAAIRAICPDLDRVWQPRGGEPVYCTLEEPEVAVLREATVVPS